MDEFNEIINSDRPTLVDFFATWCGPCRLQAPIIDRLKAGMGDRANVIKVDIDKNMEIARRYRVQSVPTLILFRSGEPVWRAVGVQQADVLESVINGHITPGGGM